ncbi:MAG: ABC transporter permease [Chloroflexi bacterium]|nr:ABC transporter permease [Chloroflexota bacterium]
MTYFYQFSRAFMRKYIEICALISSLLAALVISLTLLALLGVNPFKAIGDLASTLVTSKYLIGEVFVYGCPFLLSGLGIGIALKANYWNIGAEGQLWWGALFATIPGIFITGIPAFLHVPIVLICAFIGGAFWSLPSVFLKLKFGVNELLTNLLLNPVAVLFMNYLLWGPLKDPARQHPQSQPLQSTALLPHFFQGTRVHAGIIIAFLAAFVVYIILRHSTLGFEIRAVGDNPKAASYNGIDVKKVILKAALIAGGLSGLAGGIWVTSVQSQLMVGTFPGNGFSGYGFTAIPVALLGQLNPFGICLSSLLFGMLEALGHVMQVQIGVSEFFIEILSGIIVLFVLYSSYITWKVRHKYG